MSTSLSDQQSIKALPQSLQAPAQPSYILRGHSTPVHSLLFLRGNTRLLSGDADGHVVLWTLATKRPTVVWKAHEGTILGLGTWGDSIVTHGRDSKLCVWALSPDDEVHVGFSTQLPVEKDLVGSSSTSFEEAPRKQPWLLHVLTVSTLNFCGFASCLARGGQGERTSEPIDENQDDSSSRGGIPEANKRLEKSHISTKNSDEQSLLIAVPGAHDAEISLYHLPSEQHVGLITAPDPTHGKAGMVMALRLFYTSKATNAKPPVSSDAPTDQHLPDRERRLCVVAGYESGRTSVYVQKILESSLAHSATRINSETPRSTWQETYTCTPHSQPILSLDISAQLDCYFTSSADALIARHTIPDLRSTASETLDPKSEPDRILQSKHSGQQGLCVRNDGVIMATAGWDKRIRVYSTGLGHSSSTLSNRSSLDGKDIDRATHRPMRELAVCKWHRDGCYAAAFGEVAIDQPSKENFEVSKQDDTAAGASRAVFRREGTGMPTARQVREDRVRNTHWLAGGGKDGKITLWDMY